MSPTAARRAEYEAKILRLLAAEPMSNVDLAGYVGITRQALAFYTKGMHEKRKIHVFGYRQATIGGNAHALWGVGDKPDFVRIALNGPKTTVDIALQRKKDIVASLSKVKSAKDIAYMVNLSVPRVLKYLQFLRKTGKVRIAEWVPRGNANQWVPLYGRGNEPDAPLPPPTTKSSRARSGRTALGDDQQARDGHIASADQTVAAARQRPHNPFSALGV